MRIRLGLLKRLIREQIGNLPKPRTTLKKGSPGESYLGPPEEMYGLDMSYGGKGWRTGGFPSVDFVTLEDLFGGDGHEGLLKADPRTVTTKVDGIPVWAPFKCLKEWPKDHPLLKTVEWWVHGDDNKESLSGFKPTDAVDTLQHTFFAKSGKVVDGVHKRHHSGFRLNMTEETKEKAFDVMAEEIANHFLDLSTKPGSKEEDAITHVAPVGSTSDAAGRIAQKVAAKLGVKFVDAPAAEKISRESELKTVFEILEDHLAAGGTRENFPYKIPRDLKPGELKKKADTLKNKLEKGIKITSSDVPHQFADYFPRLYKAGRFIRPGNHYLIIDDNTQSGRSFEHTERALKDLGARYSYAAGYYWPRS